jgi:hypothetical protein
MIYIIYNQTLYYKFNKVQSITHWLFEELFLVRKRGIVGLGSLDRHRGPRGKYFIQPLGL